MSTLAREVLPHLARRHDVTYVTAGDTIPDADFVRVIRCRRYHHMNLAGFALSRQVDRLHARGLIDLAVVWGSVAFALRRTPFVSFEGTSVYAQIGRFASRTTPMKRLRFLAGLVHYAVPEILCNRRAARVVVPSESLRNDILRLHRLPPDRVVVVPHGAEPQHLRIHGAKRPAARPRILYVGRLHVHKGITEVLRAFVRRPDLDADFCIAGDGPSRPLLQALATGDARVRLLGPVGRQELEALLGTTAIFVLPTWYEGFGLALLEAMASGHACVCYDLPVLREILGDAGVLVPVGDAGALVDAIAGLLRRPDDIVSMAERAHRRARRFSWDRARASIDAILRDTALEIGIGDPGLTNRPAAATSRAAS
ncbi:MAG: glycosyltransferase family 4 protein [Candidatus Polarisedimenticolia bacterium]